MEPVEISKKGEGHKKNLVKGAIGNIEVKVGRGRQSLI